MAEHRATIDWTANGDFAANTYSRAHRWHFDGGASVPASASPHVVPVPLSDPAGVDPEEALIASAASCHMLWFLSLAQAAGFIVASYRDEAVGMMGRNAEKRVAITKIELRPEIRFEGRQPSPEELDHLHHEAHDRCFIANSLSTEIVVAKG
jgi:organic hydroperoxide reductase OsmC/OhrA